MKVKNELQHTVNVENQKGVKVEIALDNSDMLQINNIALLFAEFEKIQEIEVITGADFSEIVKQTTKIANHIEKVNEYLDKAFGKDLREKVFEGSSSLTLYNEFFTNLIGEIEKSGAKLDDYIKKTRRQAVLDSKKQPKDTI